MIRPFFGFTMRNVLITGGSRGIGRAMVEAFAGAGYRVYFLYRQNSEAALSVETSTGAVGIKADVRDAKAVKDAFERIQSECGGVDVLINNAAVSSFALLQDVSEEEWQRVMDTNCGGVYRCSKQVIPQMLSRDGGVIINISSMWGQVGASMEVHYSASKAAIIGFTKALAKELGPSNIRCNCIAPGVIDTEMNAMLDEEILLSLAEETPLGRIGRPQEIASLALYLASDAASFITGQIIGANGGFVI
ncbi:MAG: SDR family oxidoreductase [Ruminococcaceae bacterium]|nr:SDR family oxidoreductase [Oscillospiraceae bacterium]